MTLAMAVIAATLCALFARPFADYQYWFTWRRSAFFIGILLYFLIAGVGAGLLGWLVGTASHASPTSWPVVNGILFGLVGALAIRAELGAPKSRRPAQDQAVPEHFSPAVTLLNVGTIWTFETVDRLVGRAIERWLNELTDAELRTRALELAQEVAQFDDVPDPAKLAILSRLTEPMEELVAAADVTQQEGPRIRLRGFALPVQAVSLATTGSRLTLPATGERHWCHTSLK